MAAIAKLHATKQPPISLKPNILYEDYPTTAVYNSVVLPPTPGTTGITTATTITRKQVLPFCPDASDKERLVRCFYDFKEASGADNLSLTDTFLHQKVREILGGELKTTWTTFLASAIAASKTTSADYVANVREFLANYMPPNSFLILTQSLTHASKPFSMDCFEVISRLRLINILSPYLPGSGSKSLFADDISLKSAFYRLMLPQWQLNFDTAGHQLDDVAFTVNQLVTFMDQQRLHHDAQKDLERRQQSHPAFCNPRAMRRSMPYNRSNSNYNSNQNNYSSFQSRPNCFNQAPMRNFRPRPNTFRAALTPRTPTSQGNNYRAVSRSIPPTYPHTPSRGPPGSNPGRGAAPQLSFYSGRSHPNLGISDNYYMQNNNYYQEEPNQDANHDQHPDDGFFNQDEEPDPDENHPDDGFFNQDDGFFNQDPEDHFNHDHDDMFHQEDHYDHYEA